MTDWITTDDAVQLSGYNANYLRILIRTGKVKGEKWARSWQVSESSLRAYLKETATHGQKRGRKPAHHHLTQDV
jgi:hypothetical protein